MKVNSEMFLVLAKKHAHTGGERNTKLEWPYTYFDTYTFAGSITKHSSVARCDYSCNCA